MTNSKSAAGTVPVTGPVGMMNKRVRVFLFAWMILLVLTARVFAAIPQLGDANGNGQVDLADAVLVLQTTARADTAGQTVSLNNADFNMDGKIALPEAIFILQVLAGVRDISFSVRQATGKVVLPDGWPANVPLTSLIVYGQLGTSAVDANGNFSVPLSGSGIALAVVANADGTPLMLGCLTEDPALNVIGVQSTAAALLFQSLGFFTLPPASWPQARSMIAETPEAATLAATIAGRLALDPQAITKKDKTIADAVYATAEAIIAARKATSRQAASRSAATLAAARSAESTDATHVKVDGANPRSGVNIEPTADSSGITARNDFRRHVLVLVYRTGWEDKSGNRHDTPWELIVKGPFESLAKGAYLPATNAVGGVITSLIDWYTNNGAYTPSAWDADHAIALPMFPGIAPETISKTFYHIVCVGDYLGYESLPAGLKDVAQDVKGAHDAMQALEFFKEFLIPLIFAVIPSDQIATGVDKEEVLAAIDIVNLFASGVPDVATNYAAGQYKNAALAALKAFVGNPTLQKAFCVRLAKAGIIKGWNAATDGLVSEVAEKAAAVLQITDKIIAAFDQSVLMIQLGSSHPYEEWDATALWPAVRIQPKPATVEAGKNVQLMVAIGGEAGNADDYFYKFTWTTPGAHGKIVNPGGAAPAGTQVIVTSRSPGSRINYESDPLAGPGDEDKVQVLVQRVSGSGTDNLGNDETTVRVSGSHVDLDPATANVEPNASQVFTAIVKPEPDVAKGDVYYYRWENSAQFGHLAGGQDAFESKTATTVSYQAGPDKEGVDSVSLSVYRERPGTARELLGVASSMVNVRKKYAVQLTPLGKILSLEESQTYTATLEPEPEADDELVYVWDNTAKAGRMTSDFLRLDHYESSRNQALYFANKNLGADVVAADTIGVTVYRVISGERFLLAEASVKVTVTTYRLSLPSSERTKQGYSLNITAGVQPSLPAGGYLKWTNTRRQGILTDPDSGKTDNFETTNLAPRYDTLQDVNTGTDTVRVELYMVQNGTPFLLDSAECHIFVEVPVTFTIRKGTAECDYAKTMGMGSNCRSVCGAVSLTWRPPAGFAPTSYFVEMDTHGVYWPNKDFLSGSHTPDQLLPVYGDPYDPSGNLARVTVPAGEVGFWVDHLHDEWCAGSNLTFEEIQANVESWATESMDTVKSFTFSVWAVP